MIKEAKSYDHFPLWIVVLSNLLTLSIYIVGAVILLGVGIWLSGLYLLYCLWIELNVLQRSCVNCYYYGKVCGFGKGKLCTRLFKKGDPQRFTQKDISWRDLLPDFMVSIFPFVVGIILLVMQFSWLTVVLLAILVVLTLGGNAIIRGSFACKYCRQREIGCPADKLFNKGQTKTAA
jgi:hypothetical protein